MDSFYRQISTTMTAAIIPGEIPVNLSQLMQPHCSHLDQLPIANETMPHKIILQK